MRAAMRTRIRVVLCLLFTSGVALAQTGDLRQAVKAGPVVRQVLTAGDEFKDRVALVGPAAIVVVGQIVGEQPRLADDGSVVLTDYTVEISEVWVDPEGRAAPGQQIVVSHPGGQMRVEGVAVRIETPDFGPLEWLLPYVFFLDAAPGGYRFRGGAQGVWAIRDARVFSHLTRKHDYVLRRLSNGEDLVAFTQKTRNASPSAAASSGPAPKPAGERRRKVIRPDYFKIPGLGERFIAADAIVRGRVTDETMRLADDGKSVWTSYTIEVLEVYKAPEPRPAAGSTLTVRAKGGDLRRGDDVVSIVNELFPPLPWAREHVFFLRRPDPQQPYEFLDGAMSVFRRDDEGKMRCHAPRGVWDFLCTSRDGRKWEELVRDLKKR